MNINIHRATNVRLAGTFAGNANSATLEIVTGEGTIEITIYDLPERVTDKLMVLCDRDTYHNNNEV